jgi:hypothetical protein
VEAEVAREFVYMRHPDVKGIAGPVTREAFEQNHANKGWEVVSPEDDLSKLTLAQLKEKAAAIGLKVEGRTKDDYVAALSALQTQEVGQ